mmetsp:Transcript_35550/g.84216  ORF Transcript_35550/g.84216 Transcript_35550/m.84216 type:complete len:226 (-) Transcript_35550:1336-2013(-)
MAGQTFRLVCCSSDFCLGVRIPRRRWAVSASDRPRSQRYKPYFQLAPSTYVGGRSDIPERSSRLIPNLGNDRFWACRTETEAQGPPRVPARGCGRADVGRRTCRRQVAHDEAASPHPQPVQRPLVARGDSPLDARTPGLCWGLGIPLPRVVVGCPPRPRAMARLPRARHLHGGTRGDGDRAPGEGLAASARGGGCGEGAAPPPAGRRGGAACSDGRDVPVSAHLR